MNSLTSYKKTTIAVLVSATFASLSPLTAEATDQLHAQDVVVSASRVEKALLDVNMSVSVIDSDQIRRNAQAKTVADLLESMVPGLRINNDGAQGIDRIKIRGEDAFRTVVMVDGIRISEQKSMSGVPLLISSSQIERIEVIRGPASVLYGSDAIGGAINIITKKGSNAAFESEVSAGYNSSASGKDLSASISGGVNGWQYRLGASSKDYGNLETPIGEMPNTNFNAKSFDAFLSYAIDKDTTVGVTLSQYDLDFMAGSITYAAEDFYVDVPEWKRTRGGVFAEFKELNDHLVRLRIDSSYERNKKYMDNYVHTSPLMPFGISSYADNELKTASLSVQADWSINDSNYLITGYEFSRDSLNADSRTYLKSLKPMLPSRWSKHETYDGSQARHSVFASMESSLKDRLVANYGVRYTWVSNDMDIQDALSLKDKSYSSSDGKAVFNLGLSQKLTEDLTIRANWSQGYRSPILQELFIDTSMGGAITLANSDLKAETSDTYELGLRYQDQLISIDTSLFYSQADDYIATIQKGAYYQYENMAVAKTLGLELDTRLQLGQFQPYAVVTLLKREYEENGVSSTKTGTPRLTARYGLRYDASSYGVQWGVDAYAVSQTATENWNFDKNTLEARYGGTTTLNLAASASFGPKNAYSLDFGFYNITDRLYQNNAAIYEAGRHFAVKMNAQF